MNPSNDIHVEAAKLQNGIAEHLGIQIDNLIFDYETSGAKTVLNLITVNPRHSQSFLFHTESGINKIDALARMLNYVKSFRDKENSYTIQWQSKGNAELQTSYFRAKNMYEALDKLYYGRDITAIVVYSLVLNPVA